MRIIRSAALAAVALAAPLICAAEPAPLRPGLWEMKMQRDGADQSDRMREMQEQMKNMPPEQRKMVEGMMKQHGASMEGGNVRVCMSRESLDSDAWHQEQQREAGCRTQMTRSGKVWKWHSSCPAPHASESDGEATFVSDTRYTMKSTTTVDEGGRKKMHTMTGTSTWLGADCGDIQPAVPTKKK